MSFFLVRLDAQGTRKISTGGNKHNVIEMVYAPNPAGKLLGVGDSRRQEDDVDMVRQQDDNLLPDNTPLGIVDIVNLVEDDKLNVADEICALVEHAP